MRVQDIIIGENYRHISSPNIAYAKAIKIIRPKDRNFLKTEEEKKLKIVVVKCAWSMWKDEELFYTRYYRPCDLVKES